MNRREAEKIYIAGKEAVIDALYRMQAGINALENQVQLLTETVAKLSKNSSISHKAPSSDIVKPNKKKLKPGSKRKKVANLDRLSMNR